MKTPKLKKINLSKCFSKENDGSFHDHKNITTDKQYLALISGFFYAGRFSREWYGWSFDGYGSGTGIQLDKPGTNGSDWQGLWEIK